MSPKAKSIPLGAGALAATRHSGGLVATKIIDAVEFNAPIKVGDIIELTSYVTWTGRTSMEVAVEVFSETGLTCEKRFIIKTYLVFVAIDGNAEKRPVPALELETDEERKECEEAKERQALRMK